jgi:6-phosphogluconolactonase
MTMQGARQRRPLNSELKGEAPQILVSDSREKTIHQGARLFVEAIKRSAEKSPNSPVTVVLAGGSTPRELYLLLTDPAQPYYSQVPWQRLHFFWGDERFVPSTSHESNFRMAQETLLERLPVRENHHRIVTEDLTPEASAQAYQREIQMFFRKKDLKEAPSFDLILLGLGSNAHTASLFPDTPLQELNSPVYEDCWVKSFYIPTLNTMRISMTPKLINAAKEVLFLAIGKDKAEALWRVLESDDAPEKCPAKLIQPSMGQVIWDVDTEAASMLTRKT